MLYNASDRAFSHRHYFYAVAGRGCVWPFISPCQDVPRLFHPVRTQHVPLSVYPVRILGHTSPASPRHISADLSPSTLHLLFRRRLHPSPNYVRFIKPVSQINHPGYTYKLHTLLPFILWFLMNFSIIKLYMCIIGYTNIVLKPLFIQNILNLYFRLRNQTYPALLNRIEILFMKTE